MSIEGLKSITVVENYEVAVTASSGKLTVMRKKQGYRIGDFVKRMTPEARPELADWGPPRGKEFW